MELNLTRWMRLLEEWKQGEEEVVEEEVVMEEEETVVASSPQPAPGNPAVLGGVAGYCSGAISQRVRTTGLWARAVVAHVLIYLQIPDVAASQQEALSFGESCHVGISHP